VIIRTSYVVGFAFAEAHGVHYVLLQKKCRPPNQAGLWNGPGGRVEQDESPSAAMDREFEEEVGLKLGPWDRFLTLNRRVDPGNGPPQVQIEFYRTETDLLVLQACETKSATRIEPAFIRILDAVLLEHPRKIVADLSWILPLAAMAKQYNSVMVVESTIKGAYRG
jgi:8-oxo-dGTP pyrophosphatase MutT (NUDIX family)